MHVAAQDLCPPAAMIPTLSSTPVTTTSTVPLQQPTVVKALSTDCTVNRADDTSCQSYNSMCSDMLSELPEPNIKSTFDFALKMKDGQEIRHYQHELAKPGIDGKNYIIVAPTGSGKTLVAGLIISEHLRKKQHCLPCHVVFVVNTRPLAEQQKRQLEEFISDARVEVYTGDAAGTVASSIKDNNNISVCTAGKLLDEIRKNQVKFGQLSLMVFDECHHVRKGHPYARLMEHYLDERGQTQLPQIIGMTASPGAGDNSDLDKKKTIDHLLNLAALLDATGGICTVTDNVEELQRHTKNSSFTCKILKSREATDDDFIHLVSKEMDQLEKAVPKMNNNLVKWSQEYETKVQQIKQPLEVSNDTIHRDAISTLNLLRCYSSALSVYMDLQQKDAIKVMEKYSGFPEDKLKATPSELEMKHAMNTLLKELKTLPPRDNPLLEDMRRIFCDTFQGKPNSCAIIFVRTKKHAYAMCDWMTEHPAFHDMIYPDVITGHTRETGAGMTQVEQEEVMSRFRNGETNLLIATSVAEEGLDVPKCNLVIKFQHVSNEIAKVQTEGRARAEDSQGFTILSSDSKKKYQELRNKELTVLVEDVLKSGWFPTGDLLQKELTKIQQAIINKRKLKAAMKRKRRQEHKGHDVKLLCKKCKVFACFGSDIYTIGDISYHYVVPNPEFKEKITCKDHPKPRDLIANQVIMTQSIFCSNCEGNWGVQCIWPTNGNMFPVVKCASFIFEIRDAVLPLKKWKDAPFEMSPLSDWLGNSESETSFSDSDTEFNSD